MRFKVSLLPVKALIALFCFFFLSCSGAGAYNKGDISFSKNFQKGPVGHEGPENYGTVPENEKEYVGQLKNGNSPRDETLELLFDRSISHLLDYSTFKINSRTPTALMPILPSRDELGRNAEYFYSHLSQTLSENNLLIMIDTRTIKRTIEKKKLSPADLADDKSAAKLGKVLGAELLITGKLYKKGDFFELFLKLLRVKTGEVLSVTKVNIDQDLGL